MYRCSFLCKSTHVEKYMGVILILVTTVIIPSLRGVISKNYYDNDNNNLYGYSAKITITYNRNDKKLNV